VDVVVGGGGGGWVGGGAHTLHRSDMIKTYAERLMSEGVVTLQDFQVRRRVFPPRSPRVLEASAAVIAVYYLSRALLN